MELLADLAGWSILLFSFVLFAAQWLALKVGRMLGMRRGSMLGANREAEGVGLVVGGLLGLFAFVLALTLSYSSGRFQERRAGALAEANAIGTAWLRTQAIDDARSRQIATLLEQYGQLRRQFMLASRGGSEITAISERSSILQAEIWKHLSEIARERPDPVIAALMLALNDVFDTGTAERFALETRLPPQLFWLLIGIALISVGALGYQLGLKGQTLQFPVALLVTVWTAVIVVILDLSAPRLGAFRTSVSIYDWTLESFNETTKSPPRP